MTTNTQNKPLTHLELLRKYGGNIMAATAEEMEGIRAYITPAKNGLKLLFEASRAYEVEVKGEAERTGGYPAVCFNKDGHCEDDHCRCWK